MQPDHASEQAPGQSVSVNAEYFPVPIDSLESDELKMDLYLIHGRQKAVLYRAVGSSYTRADNKHLTEQGITHFYVPIVQHRRFQDSMRERMTSAYENPDLQREERTRIVRESCGKMIEDFLGDPNIPGLGETLGAMAGQFSAWCADDQSEFGYLLDMSEHDYYTTTHMMNVGVGCGLLASALFPDDPEMVRRITLGGFVHDLGKRGVPSEILNKEGKLDDDEWAQIRSHPVIGAEILIEQAEHDEIAIDMARHHHERLDGKGYPDAISADEISLPARICAVVDIYDALTSARPYRGPIPPRAVLESMSKEVGSAIDPKVFSAWSGIIERMITEDPARAVPDVPGAPAPDLGSIMPTPAPNSGTSAKSSTGAHPIGPGPAR
jgi:HD-GYP domain-containing protein (c-di-GMP phosphodiesterase class II)